jgi:hypothetical protein
MDEQFKYYLFDFNFKDPSAIVTFIVFHIYSLLQ